jgi:signal transduction histidine kinase
MSETIRANRGLRRLTRRNPPGTWRLAFYAVTVVAGALLIVWVNHSIHRQMAGLQQEFTPIQSERYYVGIQLRSSTRKLNSALLAYQLSRKPDDRAAFEDEAADLKRWLVIHEAKLGTANEREVYRRLRQAYGQYLAAAKAMMEGSGEAGSLAFALHYQRVQTESQPVLSLCDTLVKAQRVAFDDFLAGSQETLARLQDWLLVSMLLVLVLAVTLAVLVYRGMIAPLRLHLSESKAIIDRQEKLSSLGLLAAGVAHEIRNPLTAIKFRLFSLNKTLHGGLGGNEDAAVINEEINRLDRIVKDFLQFARPSPPEFLPVPADRLLQEVRDLLGAELGKAGIQLEVVVQESACLRADAQQLKQVLINLIQNAAQSIERTGTVTLGLRCDRGTLGGASQSVAVLSVADSGRGIPPEIEKRLFDPFFTTKEGGTGLGLAVAARIVEKHGGLLRYETEVNRGTVFEVVLPQYKEHATEHPPH